MSDREIYAFLKSQNCCNPCCARFLKGWKENYELCLEILQAKDIDFEEDRTEKCPSCLNILNSSFVESILNKLQEYSEFEVYDTPYIVISIQFPIILNLSQLSIWIALLERFPGTISKKLLADLSLKDVFKNMLLPRVCEITKREYNENGLFVNVYLVADNENAELVKLLSVRPDIFQNRHRKEGRAHELITRNIFDREFTPEKLSMDLFKSIFPDLKHLRDVFIRLDKITFTGPTVFMAGRYCKFSRSLSQTPWVIEGKRIMEDSVQEHIMLLNFLQEACIVNINLTCAKCSQLMRVIKKPEIENCGWDCGKRVNGVRCYYQKTIRHCTWFSQSKLKINKCLLITNDILQNVPTHKILHDYGISSRTAADWKQYVREVMVEYILQHTEPIGGPGSIVEIDESLFGKRKYHRGHHVKGQWVFGGIERSTGRCFLPRPSKVVP